MTVARILFLARYRVPHALFSLQWDRYLEGIDYTIVASPMNRDEIWPLFDRYHIDTTDWQYVNDSVVYERYPEVNNWVFPDDFRTYWLRQQAIKMAFLDIIGEDVMLMHDPDTFAIEPYRCVNSDSSLNFFALENITQGSYNGMFESITGYARQTPHCFVTELVPVKHQHFVDMKQHVTDRHGGLWLDAIIENCTSLPTLPPWGDGNLIKWFSEYEFLGNWALTQEPATFQWQRRYEYDDLDLLQKLDATRFNAVCDAVPDLTRSMQFDWHNGEVIDFVKYKNWVEQAIVRA